MRVDGTGLLFYRQVPLLERRFTVTTHRLRDTAERLDELVAELDARVQETAAGEPVTLVGESFGGALSLSDRRLRVGAPKPARIKQAAPQPATSSTTTQSRSSPIARATRCALQNGRGFPHHFS